MRLAVIIPAGPGNDLVDTVESVLAYTEPDRMIVIVDDGADAAARLAAAGLGDAAVVVPAPPGASGKHGGLMVKLSAGFRVITRDPEVDVILRMDTDALVVNPGVERIAREAFAADPALGMLGAGRIGPDGRERDLTPAADLVRLETGPFGLRHPVRHRVLRRLLREARGNGYVMGEHALGGGVLIRGSLVRDWEARGWLDLPVLASSGIADDHLLGLLTLAGGARIGELSRPGDPLAIRWRGLPEHPDALTARGVVVCHSVRGFGDLDEEAVRGRFRAVRDALRPETASIPGGSPPKH